mgnify:FL=1
MAILEALFPTADDAYSAQISLRKIDGVQEVRTERRDNESVGDRQLFLAGAFAQTGLTNQQTTVVPTGITAPGPAGAMIFGDIPGLEDDFGGRNHDVVMTCRVEDACLQEVRDAIIRAGGTIVTG